MLYFASIKLDQEVHAQGLGLTRLVFQFAYADSAAKASSLFSKWASSKGVSIEKIDVSEAVKQELSAYTFPHQIINVPVDQLEAEYNRRQYAESYRDPAMYSF